ncbi:3394_t:CDS:1, partial [Diversispora eburnea]
LAHRLLDYNLPVRKKIDKIKLSTELAWPKVLNVSINRIAE